MREGVKSGRLRSPRSHQVNEDDVPARLREETYKIFQQLDRRPWLPDSFHCEPVKLRFFLQR